MANPRYGPVPPNWTPGYEAAHPRTNLNKKGFGGLPRFSSAPENDVKAHLDIATNKLLITALYPGEASNLITVTLVDPGADGAISVSVAGPDIVVTLAYGTGAITSTYADVQAAINAHAIAKTMVVASGGTADLAAAAVEAPLAGGNTGTPGDTGDIVMKSDGSRLYMCIVASGMISWYEATFTKVA